MWLCFVSTFSQSIFSQSDSLSCTSSIFPTYSLNGKRISTSQANILMAKYPETLKYINESKMAKGFGLTLLLAGGYCLGKSVYVLMEEDENNNSTSGPDFTSDLLPYLVLGVPLTALSVYLLGYQNRNLQKAVKIFNQKNKLPNTSQNINLTYGLTAHGIGIQLNF